ncbi:MAG: DNA topoisomerase III [Verrucomicrobia bacterium]|nr:DNA topoisomerase III [Verrucomicrobiota bacterium]MDA1066627.1 DNA topoisomerase III [Verrucomicrobiota bacterium]
MKSLIIAEKPSVARDLAAALGKVPKNGDWYENDEYVISSAIGHLVELFMPEDIDTKLKFWSLKSLPIVPDKFELKPITRTKAKYQELKKLLGRKDVDLVINACDAGREGELIFTYIIDLAKCKKPVKRLWLSSMTVTAIKEAFKNLRDGEAMLPLQHAARCRSESDWLIGINGTRAITKRMFGSRAGQVATVGRVQTPTLAIIMERELEIRNFIPRDFWRITGNFGISEGQYEGVYQKPNWNKSDDGLDKVDRIWDAPTAEQIVEAVKQSPVAEVTEKKKRTSQIAPRLFDLTSLQREANNRFGFGAARTLSLAQALYERHKMLTYPRTDSKALPEDYIPTVKDTLANLSGEFQGHAQKALQNNWIKPDKRIFNNAQISDHFAIIPTNAPAKSLNADEAKLYDMIVRRFIAVFYPAAEFDVTTRLSVAAQHTFKTEGKVLAFPGWLSIYGKSGEGSDNLPALSAADGNPASAKIVSIDLKKESTKPPPRYSEATLLSAMEGAGKLLDDEELVEAMKEKGLGTPATRAQIIEHLYALKYMERDGKEIIPTGKAENLLNFLVALKAETLTSPSLTGEWEHRLHQIEEGTLSREDFMKAIADQTKAIVESVKNFGDDEESSSEIEVVSPTDNEKMMENFRSYKSKDGAVTIYKVIGNRKLTLEELDELLKEKKIGPLEGFRSKAGKPYVATLVLSDEWEVKFQFENRNEDEESGEPLNFEELPVVGTCPVNNTPVFETPNVYGCRERLENGNGENKGFRMSKKILDQEISSEQVKKLLAEGKTDKLDKFISKRTKKPFAAFLVLKKNGSVGFEFPPRPPKKKAEEKPANTTE